MERLKAAVIGSGSIGAAHMEALKRVPGVDVVTLVDIVDPVQEVEELDTPNGFLDYREMIEAVEPSRIHTCTPNYTYKKVTLYVFRHGIHVICEKPTARNAGEVKEMLETAKKSNLVHAINLHNRSYPANHQLCSAILDEALGKIYSVHGACLQDCFSQESDFNWRMLSAEGGSTHVTLDIDPHWVGLAEYVIGSKIEKVFAGLRTNLPVRKMNLAGNLKDVVVDIRDTFYATVRFENGVVSSAVFSQVYQGRKNQTMIRAPGPETSAEWDSETIGDLEFGYRNEPNRLLTKDRGPAYPDTAPVITYPGGCAEGLPDAFKQNFTVVYRAIHGVKPINPYADFEDGLHQTQVPDKTFENAKIGCWTSAN